MKLELTTNILNKPTIPYVFDLSNPYSSEELYNAMADFMCSHNGVGLAANQVGLPWSVFVIGNPHDRDNVIGVFNPMIVDTFGEEVYAEEGCLSYPGLYMKIKRPSGIRVRYTTYEGKTDTIKFEGFTARVFQHEYDHLQGIDFRDRATRYHREKSYKDMKLNNRKRKRNVR